MEKKIAEGPWITTRKKKEKQAGEMNLNMSSASGSRERRIKLNSFWLESSPPSLLPHHSDCLSGSVTNCNRVRFHLKKRNKFPVNGFTQAHFECGEETYQVFISLSFWEVKFSSRIEEKLKTKVPGKRVKRASPADHQVIPAPGPRSPAEPCGWEASPGWSSGSHRTPPPTDDTMEQKKKRHRSDRD